METACRYGNLQLVKDVISVSPDTVNISTVHGNTPLMSASLGGHYDVVKLLLSHKADVNVTNNRAETALILACRKNLLYKTLTRENEEDIAYLGCILAHDLHIQHDTSRDSKSYTDIVELLLSHGADENVTDADRLSPLILTCIFGDLKVAEILISRGVNIDNRGILDSTALMWACVFGHDKIIDRLLQAGADLNITAELNSSALLISSYFGREKIINTLISHGASVDEADSNNSTPLYYAAGFGFPHVASLLISGGAEVDKCNWYDRTPLTHASITGQSGVAELLISNGADINHQDIEDTTPLLWSAMPCHTDTVRLLVSRGAKIDTRDEHGRTALMYACLGGWDDVVELLLLHDASVNVTDHDGVTPLTLVCQHIQNIYGLFAYDDEDQRIYNCFRDNRNNLRRLEHYMNQLKPMCSDRRLSIMLGHAYLTGDIDLLSSLQRVFSDQHTDTPAVMPDDWNTRHDRVLGMLLSQGVDVNSINSYFDSALIMACTAGYGSGVRILLDRGADVNVPNRKGDTALSVASREGLSDVVQLLLNRKANVNVRGSNEETPLLQATKTGHYSTVDILLEHGADTTLRNIDGDPALVVGCVEGHIKIIEMLLHKNADVNVTGFNDTTPLIEASRKGHIDIVETLLRHGADVNISNDDGETALIVAEEEGHEAVVHVLLKHQADTNTGKTVASLSHDQEHWADSSQSADGVTIKVNEAVVKSSTATVVDETGDTVFSVSQLQEQVSIVLSQQAGGSTEGNTMEKTDEGNLDGKRGSKQRKSRNRKDSIFSFRETFRLHRERGIKDKRQRKTKRKNTGKN